MECPKCGDSIGYGVIIEEGAYIRCMCNTRIYLLTPAMLEAVKEAIDRLTLPEHEACKCINCLTATADELRKEFADAIKESKNEQDGSRTL